MVYETQESVTGSTTYPFEELTLSFGDAANIILNLTVEGATYILEWQEGVPFAYIEFLKKDLMLMKLLFS